MLFAFKRVLLKYCALVLNMHKDISVVNEIAHNLELFCDLEVMVGLSCIMPLLEGLNKLIKLSQSQCFVCDFVVAMKLCEEDLYN